MDNEIKLEGNPIVQQKIKENTIRNFYLDNKNKWVELANIHKFKPVINL